MQSSSCPALPNNRLISTAWFPPWGVVAKRVSMLVVGIPDTETCESDFWPHPSLSRNGQVVRTFSTFLMLDMCSPLFNKLTVTKLVLYSPILISFHGLCECTVTFFHEYIYHVLIMWIFCLVISPADSQFFDNVSMFPVLRWNDLIWSRLGGIQIVTTRKGISSES